jgi:hypothetical protein
MKKLIDKILSYAIGTQLLILLGCILFFGILLFSFSPNANIESEINNRLQNLENKLNDFQSGISSDKTVSLKDNFTENDSHITDRIWFIVTRMLDTGLIGDSKNKGFALLITIVGWILCGGLLITILINAYTEQIKKIEQGGTRYKFKNHCIILGYNEITENIIKEIRCKEIIPAKSSIIVLSNNDSNHLRLNLMASLSKKEMSRLYIYRGERQSKDQIKSLSIKKAKVVFIQGEENETGIDSTNIQCLKLISDIIIKKKRKGERLLCYLNIENQHIFSLMQKYDLEEEVRNIVNIQTFNIFENWARRVMSFKNFAIDQDYSSIKKQLLINTNQGEYRYIIVGFNRMGKALCNQIARVSHYGKGKRIVITIIDKKADELRDLYNMSLPGKINFPNIEFDFIKGAIESKEIRYKIHQFIKKDKLVSIAICFRNSDVSLFMGLNLPAIVYSKNIPVLIRQNLLHGFVTSINKELRFKNINFFGMNNNTLNLDMSLEKSAEKMQEMYLNMLNDSKKLDPENKSHKIWKDLGEKYRWSNRYAIDIIPHKLIALKLDKKSLYNGANHFEYGKLIRSVFYTHKYEEGTRTINKAELKELEEFLREKNISHAEYLSILEDIELIADIEHDRWITERIIGGWNYSDIPKKDESQLLHPDIKPYNELTENTKMYDREPSVDLFKIKRGKNWDVFVKTANVKAKELKNNCIVKSIENKKQQGRKGDIHCIGINNEEWIIDSKTFLNKYRLKEKKYDGFDIYEPIPEKSIIFAAKITESNTKITTAKGEVLSAKLNDIHAKKYDQYLMPDDIHNDWVIDSEIFNASYEKITTEY